MCGISINEYLPFLYPIEKGVWAKVFNKWKVKKDGHFSESVTLNNDQIKMKINLLFK